MPVLTQLLSSHTTILHFPGSPRSGDNLLVNAVVYKSGVHHFLAYSQKIPQCPSLFHTPAETLNVVLTSPITHDKGSIMNTKMLENPVIAGKNLW